MSDDRFKQARRSLIDRHNQRQQGQGSDTFDGDFEDEATAMVNLDGTPHQFSAPPNYDDEEDAATSIVSVDSSFGRATSGVPGHSGEPATYSSGQFQQQTQPPSGNYQQQAQPPSGEYHEQAPPSAPQDPYNSGQMPQTYGSQSFDAPPPQDLSGHNPQQSLVIGDSGGFDGNTQFVNLNDFADGGEAESFVPDHSTAGYEGSTQFVNINALQAGAANGGQMPIEHDQILRESYQFGAESVQHGEFTLVFALNTSGRHVVLKRIWEGDPNGMPMPVRQRVAALDQIRHPRLVSLNGMLTSETGAWVELTRPAGERLTDYIQRNGPQPAEVVKPWIQQTAEILGVIHRQGFVYANLTTDAIWIQEDGSVVLEPFDVLSFEHRGNLGAFGPPEMNFPPEQRQVYPATDIYSLAAVMTAAMTGLPLNLSLVPELPKKISAVAQAALDQNPQERPQSTDEFVERLDKGGGLPKLNMKVVIAAVAVCGVAGVAAAYFTVGPGAKPPAPPPNNANNGAAVGTAGEFAAAPEAGATNGTGATNAGTAGSTTGTDLPAPVVKAEGVSDDPRLSIETSFSMNPPKKIEKAKPDPDNTEAQAARAEVREILDDVENLVPSQQEEKYQIAMQKLANAIRISGGPTEEDTELLEDLFERDDVQRIQRDYFETIHEGLESDNVSRVKAVYPMLAGVDASAEEADFFNKNRGVAVSKVKRSGSVTPSEESDDEESDQ